MKVLIVSLVISLGIVTFIAIGSWVLYDYLDQSGELSPAPTLSGTREILVSTVTPDNSILIAGSPTIEPYTPDQTTETLSPDTFVGSTLSTQFELPQAVTATPLPPQQVILEISDDVATAQTLERLEVLEIENLSNLSIHFTTDSILVSGEIVIEGPRGIQLTQVLQVTCGVEVASDEDKLETTIIEVTVGGSDFTDSEYATDIKYVMDNWFDFLLIRRDVISYKFEEGKMLIEVLDFRQQ